MLLVHGFLSSNAQWDLNRHEMGKHFRLLMVELPGHGRSDGPNDAKAYTSQRLVEAFEQVRKDAGVSSWWVCGQSLGGAISILYCLAHSDRVRGLIFTNSRAAFGIKREGVSSTGGQRPRLASTRDLPVHPVNATRLEEQMKTRMVAAADDMPLHAVEHFLDRRHTWKSTDRLGELTMPVLLVNGRWEKSFQPFAEQARSAIADIDVVSVEGGHAINAEQPDAFNTAVINFVNKNEGLC